MALARTRRSDSGMNYWPGFVDALSTLILGIIFLLTVFVVVQFYLQQEVAGKDTALDRLKSQIAQLTSLLSMEKTGKAGVEDQLAQLRNTLAVAQSDRDKFKGLYEGAGAGVSAAKDKVGALTTQLEGEKKLSARALAQVEVLNQQISAMRRQLAALEEALNASEKKDKEAQNQISDLGQRLNLALAERVKELSRYRSDFFGKLREILGNRPDMRIVGDRFVLQSEVFFDSGKADLKPAGDAELGKVAEALIELEGKIPTDIPWVLRVDGHTDVRPISAAAANFKSNWDLSAARAIAVVKYLIARGVSPQRLVAAGFGEFQPIDAATTEEAYRRNRRIEFKLTER
jgi:chemotaxis protein MotB